MRLPTFSLDASARVWHRLWSVRFALAAALMSVLHLWQPLVSDVTYAVAATVLALLSAGARVVHQPRAQDTLDSVSGSRTC